MNFEPPSVGAGDYYLQQGDEVLWYFGKWGELPTRLSLDKEAVEINETVTALVKYYSQNTWQPLESATLKIGSFELQTDSTGQVSFSFAQDGYYLIYATRSGFIRSNKINLKVGSPKSHSVNLKVEIEARLTIPKSFGSVGEKQGTLIFWAVKTE